MDHVVVVRSIVVGRSTGVASQPKDNPIVPGTAVWGSKGSGPSIPIGKRPGDRETVGGSGGVFQGRPLGSSREEMGGGIDRPITCTGRSSTLLHRPMEIVGIGGIRERARARWWEHVLAMDRTHRPPFPTPSPSPFPFADGGKRGKVATSGWIPHETVVEVERACHPRSACVECRVCRIARGPMHGVATPPFRNGWNPTFPRDPFPTTITSSWNRRPPNHRPVRFFHHPPSHMSHGFACILHRSSTARVLVVGSILALSATTPAAAVKGGGGGAGGDR